MIDSFALLSVPRRPWLEAEPLKAAFQRLAAQAHPDAGGDADRFAALNRAHSTLRDPALRLRHLLELEFGETEPLAISSEVPPALADLFMEMAGRRQKLEAFLACEKTAASPLARALLLGEKAALRDSWRAMESLLERAQAATLERLRALDARWEARGELRVDLAALQRDFSYLGRWNAQLREALFALES